MHVACRRSKGSNENSAPQDRVTGQIDVRPYFISFFFRNQCGVRAAAAAAMHLFPPPRAHPKTVMPIHGSHFSPRPNEE